MNALGKNTARPIEVEPDADGQRLDNFLFSRLKGAPKSLVYRVIRSGEVRLNGARSAPSARVQAGDVIRVPPIRLSERPAPSGVAARSTGPRCPVLYEDEWLLVVDKPAGLAVHGGSGVSLGAIEALRAARPQLRFLELAHRLDRDTSGVLLLAKKRSALLGLHEQLRKGEIDKRYLALVKGRWTEGTRRVRLALHKYVTAAGERRVDVVREGGMASETVLRLQAGYREYSLLEAELKTGRTHQIRVHLSHLGFPILGDDKYGDFSLNKALAKRGLKRMFLHAARVSFAHPATGVRLDLQAALPEELQAFLRGLEGVAESTRP